ncbi:class I SAM-dependent methyltransferase [Pontiellaceae bacterium B12227]|nr:class I SAM-dependent methyltransferase [Pontiellaceae bacterium B12227]
MKNPVLSLLLKLGGGQREKRMARMLDRIRFKDGMRVLDVGGSGDWNWESVDADISITTINLYPATEVSLENYVQGDACDMHMFQDGEFDLVFSNSVIEHLPSKDHQQRMAAEIKRVGKTYWVQTPNKHFPLELHLCCPFIQYFPVKFRIAFAKIWPFSFEKMRGRTEGAVADAQAILQTKKQFNVLFPGTKLICEKFMGMTKSLIVIGEHNE